MNFVEEFIDDPIDEPMLLLYFRAVELADLVIY